jgi:hypothetical protein
MKAVVLTEEHIDAINNMFSRYSTGGAVITFRDMLSIDNEILARVECSGSKGWYVEVARWNDVKLTFQRFCFCKLFNFSEAEEITNAINWHFRSNDSGLIHSLNNYGE